MAEFNPIKEEVNGKKAMAIVWSTSTINAALKGLDQGKKLIANPFYENNTKLLKGDLVFKRTDEELIEYKKCMKDILYFSSICKLMTPTGIQQIELRDYQKRYLQHLVDNQLSIYLSCRQAGKTTTSALFLLWYILFNVDKNALVLGNKRKTAVEILDKIKKIYLELPYFLKPGIYKWNETEIAFDNGCRIMAEATVVNSGISFTFHCVLADEFAHIHPNILDAFYNNLFPVITAGNSKFMITSTQNGYNLFYRLYTEAVAGNNDFKPFKTDWDEVPNWNPETKQWEKRDEKWHQRQVANYGGEEAFNKQFGTNFDINANTLINTKVLRKKVCDAVLYKNNEDVTILDSQYFYFHPDISIQDIRNWITCITIDIAEGHGGDYTVYTFNRLTQEGQDIKSYTYGYFACNDKPVPVCVEILREFCIRYMDMNKYIISLESNLYGDLFVKCMMENIEKDANNIYRFNEDVFIKYYNEEGTRFTIGKRVTAKSKMIGLSQFKTLYEKGLINNPSAQFLNELSNFCDTKGNGTYQASFGHDDLVMSQVHLVFALETTRLKDLLYYSTQSQSAFNEYDYNPYGTSFSQIPSYDILPNGGVNNVGRLNRFN